MDIRAQLLKEHTKVNSFEIVEYIGTNKKRFAELMDLFLANEKTVTQRAAWVVNFSVEAHPQLIMPHLKTIIENLRKPVHVAVKRNTVRMLTKLENIPEDLMGLVADVCFDLLASPTEGVAVRIHSMTILGELCKKEPDLGNELRVIIEEFMPHGTAGFRSRGRKTLKLLNK